LKLMGLRGGKKGGTKPKGGVRGRGGIGAGEAPGKSQAAKARLPGQCRRSLKSQRGGVKKIHQN